MTKEEILVNKEEISYSIYATHDGIEWFKLHGRKDEYISPRKVIAALKDSGYKLENFKETKLVKNIKIAQYEEMDIIQFL